MPPSIRKFWLLVYVHSSFRPIKLAWSCLIYTVLVVYVSHKPNSLSVGHQWHHLVLPQSQAKNGSCFLVISRKQWNGLHFTIVYLKHEGYPKLRLLGVRVFALIRTVLQLLRLTFQTNPSNVHVCFFQPKYLPWCLIGFPFEAGLTAFWGAAESAKAQMSHFSW